MHESNHIYYKSGYKYQLTRDALFNTGITGYSVNTRFLKLTPDGWFLIKAGYAWDGPSGPTLDTLDSMRPSLPHDGCYQLMRLGLISEEWREHADRQLHERLLADGMNAIRAGLWYEGVREFAADAASGENAKKEIKAP